jgi:hypothetical protein
MSALIGLFVEITAFLFVKSLKLVWYGGKWLLVGTQSIEKTEDEKRTELISQELHLITNKLDQLTKEVYTEKKLKESLTLRRSI